MKFFVLFLFIHLFAYTVVRAEDSQQSSVPAVGSEPSSEELPPVKSELPVDECRDLLPQLEQEHKEIDAKYRSLNQANLTSQDGYLVSFNQITQVLFQMVQAREDEALLISQSRDRLKGSIDIWGRDSSADASKALQSDYLDLTVRLYSSLMDAQQSLETLKTQFGQVEASRGQMENHRQELEAMDHQKLALEGKLISMKIKCQSVKRL